MSFPFSNFQACDIFWLGHTWPTLEHAYQASKSLHIEDHLKILACETPGQAKRMGRTLWQREDWEQVKIGMMLTLLILKFRKEPFRTRLLEHTEEIVEDNNWHDIFWGRCTCITHQGEGENNLGRLLTFIRDYYLQDKE